ncbi:MAG: hypothetical protein JWQ71_2720 [Pedosphaera sp.]|nr:hypothetical protein [Pedosphaera sp.]
MVRLFLLHIFAWAESNGCLLRQADLVQQNGKGFFMQYDRFVGHVQHRAQLPSNGEAIHAIRATLPTLAERLTPEEAKDLASQLPQEIGVFLHREPSQPAERLSLDDFFHRVSEREGKDLPTSVYHARVVIEVLKEAVSPGEMRDVQAQLPAEFSALFEAGSRGHLSAK